MIIRTYSQNDWLKVQSLLVDKGYHVVEQQGIFDSFTKYPCIRVFNSLKTYVCVKDNWKNEPVITAAKFISYAHQEF